MTPSPIWYKNQLRKSDQGRKRSDIDFFRDRIVNKNSLDNALKFPDYYGKEYFIYEKIDWHNQGLHIHSSMKKDDWLNQGLNIQTYFYNYIIYSWNNKLLHSSKVLILYLM